MENILRKKIRENDNVRSELDTEEKAKMCEDPSQFLTYDVLRMIFKYLNGMDLSSASMVCRSWLEAANNEKRIRGPVVSLIESNQESFAAANKANKEEIKRLNIKPALGLLIRGCDIRDKDCHCTVLPANCNTITLSTYGGIINNKEMEDMLPRNMICAFLPEIPNATVNICTLGEELAKTINLVKLTEMLNKEIETALGPPGQNTDRSKCLLLFCNLSGRRIAIKVAHSLRRRYQHDALSVWGGVANEVVLCKAKNGKRDECTSFTLCTGIVLSGAVQTWSIIIDNRCDTKEKVECRIKSLRSHVCLKKHSLGFMFACCERGTKMFHECNVESTIFKKIFPEIPLVGCFGDGEFGENTIPDESPKKKIKWYNEVSTVILILTYG